MSLGVRMVVDDLEQVMVCVFKHHEYTLILEDDLFELHNVGMIQLGAERHFPDGRLRETSILNGLAFLFRFEPRPVRRIHASSTTNGTYFLIANSPFRLSLAMALYTRP